MLFVVQYARDSIHNSRDLSEILLLTAEIPTTKRSNSDAMSVYDNTWLDYTQRLA